MFLKRSIQIGIYNLALVKIVTVIFYFQNFIFTQTNKLKRDRQIRPPK